MFTTLEDEAESANLIVWPSVFEKNRRTILSASMLGCRGKVQRASDVIHLIVEQLVDLTADLKTVSGLDASFPLVPGCGDEAKHAVTGPIAAILDRLPSRETRTSPVCASTRSS